MRRIATAALLLSLATTTALAGGLGIPTGRAGLGIGNLPDFTGIRLNFRDQDVDRVTGLNLTVWPGGDERGTGSYTGVGFHLAGNSGREFTGVYLSLFGLGVEERATGVFINGLGMGGGEVNGIMIAGLGAGAGDLNGLVLAGLGAGAENVTGVMLAGLGAGVEDIDGVAAALLGFGAEDVTGIVVAGLGTGAEDITGIAVGGLGMGGEDLTGLFAGGLGMGAETLTGVGIGGGVRTRRAEGAALAIAYQRTERLAGISTGVYNRADEATGLMIGVYNHAERLSGVQIGLLNHVGSGPSAARWLPLINARF
jgi:hypothetical protein